MKLSDKVNWDVREYGKFSNLIWEYLTQDDNTKEFYHRFPSEGALTEQALDKLKQYKNRDVTYEALKNQLSKFDLSPKQKENLDKFKMSNGVTITTGHQLNLLTGPMYFLHKISQVLKSCEVMNKKFPEFNFIPIFWMATEDHDFVEINHFFFKNNRYTWEKDAQGAVGRLDLKDINGVFDEFFSQLPDSERAKELKSFIENSYLSSSNLTEATQKLVQQLFGEAGLLFIDGDDKELKKLMIPAFKEDLLKNTAFKVIETTNKRLESKDYHLQVHPREINLFYLGEGNIRERIVKLNDEYHVLNSNYKFTESELLKDLEENPDRYSPNVILRPLYQETVLPNLAYSGGSGEMAYWMQLKGFFDSQNILFPILIVRNSLLFLTERQKGKMEKLGISYKDLFLPLHELINQNVLNNSEVEIDFDSYQSTLNKMFDELNEKATQTNVTFSKMVDAQRSKQLKGLEKMKRRLEKAERIKQEQRVEQIKSLYDEIFPNGILQEREVNFSEFWLDYGQRIKEEIYNELEPVDFQFGIKVLSY